MSKFATADMNLKPVDATPIITAGINAASDLGSAALDIAATAGKAIGDVASLGMVSAVDSAAAVLTTIGNTITGVVKANQQGATDRWLIANEVTKGLIGMDTNKHSNVAFVGIGGFLVVLLIFVKMKQTK